MLQLYKEHAPHVADAAARPIALSFVLATEFLGVRIAVKSSR